MSKVYHCAITKVRYFNVEADSRDQMMNWLVEHSDTDVDNLTKEYKDSWNEEILGCDSVTGGYKPHFSIAEEEKKWIIARVKSNEDRAQFHKVIGTKQKVRDYLLKLANEDKNLHPDEWVMAPNGEEGIEEHEDGLINTFAYYDDYFIEYYAVPDDKPIEVL